MQVTLIPVGHAKQIWPEVRPHLEKAAEYTYGRYTVDDILVTITDYDHSLWVAFDGPVIKGAVVTCFKHYPRKSYVDMVFCGGVDGHTWKDPMLKVLKHYAYDSQCAGIESSGRLGWAEIFKHDGYKMLWQTYELPAAETGLGA